MIISLKIFAGDLKNSFQDLLPIIIVVAFFQGFIIQEVPDNMTSIIIGLASLGPFIFRTYNIWYAILLFLGVEISLGVVVVSFIIKPGISSAILGARLLKLSTLFGLIAIYFGTF